MHIGPISNCQSCGASPLESILFVGYLPPVNTMPKAGQPLDQQMCFPLELVLCSACSLAQIDFVAPPELLFPPDYPYTTGTTRILRDNFAQLAEEATGVLGLKTNQLVIDIGSNDGTLLSNFVKRGHPVLGIEPTDKSQLAIAAGVRSWNRFFNKECAHDVVKELGRPALVTAANVFAHIPDPVSIVAGIAEMIGDEGVFINESHYFLSLVETLQYDTIYHEHLRYYSLKAMVRLLETAGLRVFKVKTIPTHGGSIRVYSSRNPKYVPDASVAQQLKAEEDFGLHNPARLRRFATETFQSKADLLAMLGGIRAKNGRVFAIGAPSRASTLINYCGLDKSLVEAVMEVPGSHKNGRLMPGSDIPVQNEEALYREQPDYALLFSWHIADEIIPNLTRKGFKGDFIVPLPTPRIVANPNRK